METAARLIQNVARGRIARRAARAAKGAKSKDILKSLVSSQAQEKATAVTIFGFAGTPTSVKPDLLNQVRRGDPLVAGLKDRVTSFYTASQKAAQEMPPTSPVRLNVALQYARYLRNQKQSDKACQIAKSAFDDAIAELDTLSEEDYKEATLVMQLLRDDITKWVSEETEEAKEAQEATEAKPEDTPKNDEGAAVKLGNTDMIVAGILDVAGGDGTGKYYCGRDLGPAAIPGSDGQCGPSGGLQCASCKRYQASQAPRFRLQANNQANKNDFPLRVETVFPGGTSTTSGFGGTGTFGGTYRNFQEIKDAWEKIPDSQVPGMGGHQKKYPGATKGVAYPNLMDQLEKEHDALVASGSGKK